MPAGDPIGQIDIVIGGDYSELQQAINQAIAAASAGAQQIADAFNSVGIGQMAADATAQIQKLGNTFTDVGQQINAAGDDAAGFGEAIIGSLGKALEYLQALGNSSFADVFERAAASAQDLANAINQVQAAAQQTAAAVQRVVESASGVQSVASSFGDLSKAIQAGAESLGLFELGKWILDQAEQFQEATQQIVANTGAIGDQLATLQGDFQTVFAQVPQSAADVGAALGLISSKLGETGSDLDNLAKTLADISTITGASLDQLASKATSTFNQWQVATEDQIQELTNLLHVAEAAGVPLTQLLTQLNQFGPAAREMGLSLDQAAEMFGSLDQQGYNAQQVVMALRTEMTRLAKEGVPDVAASMETWVSSIKDAATDTDALSIAAQGGARNATSLVDAIRSGAVDFDNFAGKLQLTTSSISEQKDAAETLGQVWTGVLHQLDVDFGGALSGVGNILKQLGQATQDFLSAPASYAKVAAEQIVLAYLSMENQVLQSFAEHPILENILGGPDADDLINAAIQGVGTQIVNLSVDMATTIAAFNQQKAAADNLKTSLDNLGGGGGGGGVIPQLGKDFDELGTEMSTAFEQADKLLTKMPADFADFQAGLAAGFNFKGLDNQFTDFIQNLDRTGVASTDFGQSLIDAVNAAKITLDGFLLDENLQKAGDAFDALNDKIQKLNATDLSHLAAQIGSVAAVAQALGQDSPFAKLNADLQTLGITADGTTQKMSAQFSAFNDLVQNSGASLNEIEGAWAKIQGDVAKLASSSGGLGEVVSLSDKYLSALQNAGASESQILAATTSVYSVQLKVAEASGASADSILQIGVNLDNAKAKQNAFNDSTQGMLNLYTDVQKEFASAWTQFGTGIADAIVGAKSFGSAMMDALDQMEKKITELVVNYLLGQLKDAFIQNTKALSDFGSVFNSIFGTGISSSGSMVGTAVNAGGLGNLPIQGGGTVATGSTDVANGITNMTTGIIGTLENVVNLLTGIGTLITGIIQSVEQAHTNTLLDRIEGNTRQTYTYLEDGDGVLGYLAKMLPAEADLSDAFTGWFHDALASLMQTVEDIDTHVAMEVGGSGGGGTITGGVPGGPIGGNGGTESGSGTTIPTTGGTSTVDTGTGVVTTTDSNGNTTTSGTSGSYTPTTVAPQVPPVSTTGVTTISMPTSPDPSTGVVGTPIYVWDTSSKSWVQSGYNFAGTSTVGTPGTTLAPGTGAPTNAPGYNQQNYIQPYSGPQNGEEGQQSVPPNPDTGIVGSASYSLVGAGTPGNPLQWIQTGIHAGAALGQTITDMVGDTSNLGPANDVSSDAYGSTQPTSPSPATGVAGSPMYAWDNGSKSWVQTGQNYAGTAFQQFGQYDQATGQDNAAQNSNPQNLTNAQIQTLIASYAGPDSIIGGADVNAMVDQLKSLNASLTTLQSQPASAQLTATENTLTTEIQALTAAMKAPTYTPQTQTLTAQQLAALLGQSSTIPGNFGPSQTPVQNINLTVNVGSSPQSASDIGTAVVNALRQNAQQLASI